MIAKKKIQKNSVVVANSGQQQQLELQSNYTPKTINNNPNKHPRQHQSTTNQLSKERLTLRNRQLSLCVICLMAAISTLSPLITSLHLNHHLGLLIFETDLIQLRSSWITVIICSLALLLIHSIIFIYHNYISSKKLQQQQQETTGRFIQKFAKYSLGFFASLSGLIYLSMGLFLTPIYQVQRMPSATFDCNANLITIENCHQQYASISDNLIDNNQWFSSSTSTPTPKSQSRSQTQKSQKIHKLFFPNLVNELLFSDLSQQNGRLINQLNCLRYTKEAREKQHYQSESSFDGREKNSRESQIPTRFLLHQCNLVCGPQIQSLHQFGDDLNRAQQQQQYLTNSPASNNYNNNENYDSTHSSHPSEASDEYQEQSARSGTSHVNLKVCFSDEFNTGSSYKQFCITKLANSGQRDRGLTVAQLNAVLKRFVRLDSPSNANNDDPTTLINNLQQQDPSQLIDDSSSSQSTMTNNHLISNGETSYKAGATSNHHDHQTRSLIDNQATHYMNPLFQFESHFRNWDSSHHPISPIINETIIQSGPSRSSVQAMNDDFTTNNNNNFDTTSDSKWCRFKPIPPFIVNNKPFSDIQCSIEQQYTVSTSRLQPPSSPNYLTDNKQYLHNQDKIFLRRHLSLESTDEPDYMNSQSGSPSQLSHERCNIKCKVNILYQIHRDSSTSSTVKESNQQNSKLKINAGPTSSHDSNSMKSLINDIHYYLPLKPCLIVKQPHLKRKLVNQYLFYRSLGDSSFLITFLLLDLLLLIESIDYKRAQLEAKKFRFIGLLCAIFVTPLVISLIMDATKHDNNNENDNNSANLKNQESQQTSSLLNDSFLIHLVDFISKFFHTTNDESMGPQKVNQPEAARNLGNLDYFGTPFILYAILLMLLTFNAFALPIVSPSARLIRTTSTEALGLTTTAHQSPRGGQLALASKVNAGVTPTTGCSQSNLNLNLEITTNSDQQQKNANSKIIAYKYLIELSLFVLLTLFMGVQLTFSQTLPIHILLDTLGNPLVRTTNQNSHQNSHSMALFWFTSSVYSGASLVIVVGSILFAEELSSLFANFSPFDTTLSASQGASSWTRKRIKLIQYLSISIFVYSIRFFILANLTAAWHRLYTRLLIFLFNLTEIFNFPITWLTLTGHAQSLQTEWESSWILTQEPATTTSGQNNDNKQSTTTDSKSVYTSNHQKHSKATWFASRKFNIHLAIQSIVALLYFIVARSLALLGHSMFVSGHLHSDNIDWFITSLYQGGTSSSGADQTTSNNNAHQRQNHHNAKASKGAGIQSTTSRLLVANSSLTQANSYQHSAGNNNPHNDSRPMNSVGQSGLDPNPGVPRPESLFSPLPSDQQTYLYATRLFVKHNAFICLLVASALLINFIWFKYRVWLTNQRRSRAEWARQNPYSRDSDRSIEERLSLDLKRIQQDRVESPRPLSSDNLAQLDPHDEASDGDEFPRAKILFHYETIKRRSSSSESSSLGVPELGARERPRPTSHRNGRVEQSKQEQTSRTNIPTSTRSDGVHNSRATTMGHSGTNSDENMTSQGADSASDQVRIPIELEHHGDQHSSTTKSVQFQLPDESSIEDGDGQIVQSIKSSRRRVVMYHDEERWSPIETIDDRRTPNDVVHSIISRNNTTHSDSRTKQPEESIALNEKADPQCDESPIQMHKLRARTIKFAPTAVLIANNTSSSASGSALGTDTPTPTRAPRMGSSNNNLSSTYTTRTTTSSSTTSSHYVARASPEPSIGADSNDDDDDDDNYDYDVNY